MTGNLKYGDITEKVIGCAMTVHRKMGCGYPEIVYEKCLTIEMGKTGLHFVREAMLPVYYDNVEVHRRRVDFFVEGKIAVEIKALADMANKELAQALNYLETQQLDIGLLINFGSSSLPFKRLINERKATQQKNPSNPKSNPPNPRL